MNNQSMHLSSTRPAISTVESDDNCMKEKPKNTFLNNSELDVPFGVRREWQTSNLIGDSINIHDGPRAVMVTGSGEKYILPLEEEVLEKSPKENDFYFKSKYDSQDVPSKTSWIHGMKASKNSYIHSSQKVRLNITPLISNTFDPTHSHHNTNKSSSKSSNTGTQTPLKGNELYMPAITKSASSEWYPYTIGEDSPLQKSSEISELHKGQTLPHPSELLSNDFLEEEPKSSYRNIWKDKRCISTLFSVVSILFWVLSIYFEVKVVTDFFKYIVYKIRSLYGFPEPQRTKFQIFKDFIYRMLM